MNNPSVILLCGYKREFPLAIEQLKNQSLVNHQIDQLLRLNLNVIVSLAYEYADIIIDHTPLLEKCEMVFDTNESPNWITNIKSGLFSIPQFGFVLPLETPTPQLWVWNHLLKAHNKIENRAHMIQPCVPVKGQIKPGFPLLITESGKHFLLDNESDSVFSSENLSITRFPILSPEILFQFNVKNISHLNEATPA